MKLVDISRTKKKEYRKVKIDELKTNSKIKNIKDLYIGSIEFKKGYQPGTNTVKNEKDDSFTNAHFSQLLNVPDVNDVRQTERHKAEPLVPKPRAFNVEMNTEKPNDTNHQVLIKSQQN